jgi:flagellar biosynthesis/type III secretory pathway M-ring protein FliF/YscJ
LEEKGGRKELDGEDESSPALEESPEERERQRKRNEVRESFSLPPVLTSKTEILTKQLTEEAQKDPVALAQIIRSWLNEGTQKH